MSITNESIVSLPTDLGVSEQVQTVLTRLVESLDQILGLREGDFNFGENFNSGILGQLEDLFRRLARIEQALEANAEDFQLRQVLDSGLFDYTPPPIPVNFTATSGLTGVFLKWDNPHELYDNHKDTQIFRSLTNDLETAEFHTNASASFMHHDDDVVFTQHYYYWIRFISLAEVVGPFNSEEGTIGSIVEDPAQLLERLSGALTNSELATELNSEIDLISGPSSLAGSVNARILVQSNAIEEALTYKASVQQLETATTIDGESITTLYTELESIVNDPESGLSSRASMIEIDTAIATATGSEVTSLTQLASISNENKAFIQEKSSVVDGLEALWSIKASVNDITAGIGLYVNPNDPESSLVYINAETVAIGAPGAEKLGLVVQNNYDGAGNNRVVMDAASIVNLIVTNAMVDSINVAKLDGVTSNWVLSNIGTGNIDNAYIGNIIESTNYAAGSTGWRINKNGTVEFRDGYFRGNGYFDSIYARGDIEASTLKANVAMIDRAHIKQASVDTLRIAGNAVTIPVSAKESGSISVSAGSLISAAMDSQGAPVTVSIGLVLSVVGNTYNAPSSIVTIKRDSTVLAEFPVYFAIGDNDPGDDNTPPSRNPVPVAYVVADSPPAGWRTYSVTATESMYVTGTYAHMRSICLLGTRR